MFIKIGMLFKIITMLLFSASIVYSADKVYNVGVDDHYPPFSYQKDGKLEGFDVDIAKAICEELHIKCNLVLTAFDEVIPSLEKKTIDFAVMGMAYSETRAKKVLFTDRYFRSNSIFVSIADAPLGISQRGLKGKKIAVQAGSAQDLYITETYADVVKIVRMDRIDTIIEVVKSGEVDLAFLDGLSAYYHLTLESNVALDILGTPVTLSSSSCMVLNKDYTKLRDRINAAITKIRDNGVYDRINRKYFDFPVY